MDRRALSRPRGRVERTTLNTHAKTRPPPADVDNRTLVLFDRGDEVVVQGGESGIRFLLVSGQPLQEPDAWYGPILINTQAQLLPAFTELEQGTFLQTYDRRPSSSFSFT